MARGDRERIADVLSAVADIRADTEGMGFAEFEADATVMRSVLYSIGVIGEAAKNLGARPKAASPDIPWRAIAGIRDRLVHEYFRTSTRRIWDVVVEELDPLESALRRLSARDDPQGV